ncbi:MAG: alternative oxidase [Patescibacteria group bacterium]
MNNIINHPSHTIPAHSTAYHHKPSGIGDHIAYGFVQGAVFFANLFFRERYGHRAVVLETVAAIPGMVGGLFQHLRSLRHIKSDHGWIKTLLDEAENERMHLIIFIHLARPTTLERLIIAVVQVIFYCLYFTIYLLSARVAHRLVGYLEEEATRSYTHYLEQVEKNPQKNVAAPEVAIKYWGLPSDARLRDVIITTRSDEMRHRETNHAIADKILHAHS